MRHPDPPFKVFDGHNDLAYQLWRRGGDPGTAFLEETETGLHITARKARTGGLAGGLFALFVPQQAGGLAATDPVDEEYAFTTACQMADGLQDLAAACPDDFRLCTTASEIDAARSEGVLAGILHLEGAEPVGANLDHLADLYQRGAGHKACAFEWLAISGYRDRRAISQNPASFK